MRRVRSRLVASQVASSSSGARGGSAAWEEQRLPPFGGDGAASGVVRAWPYMFVETPHWPDMSGEARPGACPVAPVPRGTRTGRAAELERVIGSNQEPVRNAACWRGPCVPARTRPRRTLVAARSVRSSSSGSEHGGRDRRRGAAAEPAASRRKRRRRETEAGYGRTAAQPRPAASHGVRHEAEEAVFNFPATHMGSSSSFDHPCRNTGGGWYFRYRPVPGWLATVRSGFCGPDCAAHHRRRRFHLQALTSDGSSRPGPEAVRRGKQRPEACSPALVSWWRAKVHAGGYPTRVC